MTLPEGWKMASIGELAKFSSGHGFSPKNWSSSGLPIIRIQNLNGSRDFNYFAGEPEQEWIVEQGELLYAWAGTRGVSFGPTVWNGPRGVLNQHIYRVRPEMNVNDYWLYAVLEVATRAIERRAHGFKSSLVHVRQSEITDQRVVVPTVDEQHRIATILCTWNKAIEKTAQLIYAKRDYRQVLAQQLLFGRRRFKEFEDQEWQRHRIGDMLCESRIRGNDGATAKKLTVRLYGKGVVEKSEKLAGSQNTQYYVRKAGQFIYSKLDFLNGAFGIVPQDLEGYESTLDLPAFDVSSDLDPGFLLYYVTREAFYKRYGGSALGGRKARRVSPNQFLQTTVALPQLPEQASIVAVLDASNKEIALLEKQLEALKLQKKGLMQKLLTGEKRVRV